MTWVKICGNRTLDGALAAAQAGADAVGFVFVPGVRRRVEPAEAREIAAALPGDVERIGIFVDATADEIARVFERAALTGVQLHGSESPSAVGELRERLGPRARIIKAWRVKADAPRQPDLADRDAPLSPAGIDGYPADAHLVEGFHPGSLGGAGQVWDWRYLAALAREHPERRFILAGGLRPDTVAGAIRVVRPWGVDVSSGVERDGVKDPDLIRAFVAAAKSAAAELGPPGPAAARREQSAAPLREGESA